MKHPILNSLKIALVLAMSLSTLGCKKEPLVNEYEFLVGEWTFDASWSGEPAEPIVPWADEAETLEFFENGNYEVRDLNSNVMEKGRIREFVTDIIDTLQQAYRLDVKNNADHSKQYLNEADKDDGATCVLHVLDEDSAIALSHRTTINTDFNWIYYRRK